MLHCFYFIKKESLAQVFSSEFSEIFKNIFFYRRSLVAASVMTSVALIFTWLIWNASCWPFFFKKKIQTQIYNIKRPPGRLSASFFLMGSWKLFLQKLHMSWLSSYFITCKIIFVQSIAAVALLLILPTANIEGKLFVL